MSDDVLRGLYLVTPDCRDSGQFLARLEAALAGKPALVQYRNKLANDDARIEQAAAAAALCRAAGALFIVNDSVELAHEVGADGVHLGREDCDPTKARARAGAELILGVSCYDDWTRAERAVEAGADYVAFGAMFPSRIKPEAVRAPLSLVTRAHEALGIPIATIGGITLENAPALVAAGADMLAVISDVFDAADPAARAAAYAALFEA